NAALDSLQELHRVRGVGDDFWGTFVEPDPDNPDKRTLTVWGQGAINVNTANPQTILAFICASGPTAKMCTDPLEAQKFLTLLTVLRGFTAGAPLFSSPSMFVSALQLKGPVGTMLQALGFEAVPLLSPDLTKNAATTESKVFSIYATGYVRVGK